MSSTIVTPGPPTALQPTGQPKPFEPGEYVAPAAPNVVTIGLRSVNPPSPLYIQRDDVLAFTLIASFNNAVATITGRFLRAGDGVIIPFATTLKQANGDSIAEGTLQLGEGYLLSVAASGANASMRGAMFVQGFLIRGTTSLNPITGVQQVLFADYITQNAPTGWPGGRIINSAESTGRSAIVNGSNPAAGTDFNIPSFSAQTILFRPIYYTATLTTSATVANRVPTFKVGGIPQYTITAQTAVAASSTKIFFLAVGVQPYTDANGNFFLPLPVMGLDVFQDSTLFATSTAGIQAADQWSAIRVVYTDLRQV